MIMRTLLIILTAAFGILALGAAETNQGKNTSKDTSKI